MTYREATAWLFSTQMFGIKLGLDGPRRLLREFLAYPKHGVTVIHVAGTNGKGSTCAMMDSIARACGLNRAKLTRGFREMFDCTIAEALAARRLLEASRLLLTTDLPVSSIGYESGYLNNASFSRAFGRHFGRSPSHYRAFGMAA